MSLPANKKVELLGDLIVAKAPHKKGEIIVISPLDYSKLLALDKVRFIEDVPVEAKKAAVGDKPKKEK